LDAARPPSDQAKESALRFILRRAAKARPANPSSIDTQVDGSGTAK
jgi:hypothetical protein